MERIAGGVGVESGGCAAGAGLRRQGRAWGAAVHGSELTFGSSVRALGGRWFNWFSKFTTSKRYQIVRDPRRTEGGVGVLRKFTAVCGRRRLRHRSSSHTTQNSNHGSNIRPRYYWKSVPKLSAAALGGAEMATGQVQAAACSAAFLLYFRICLYWFSVSSFVDDEWGVNRA